MKACFSNKSFIVLSIALGGGIGMFNCLYTVIQQLLCPVGYTNTFSGFCASTMIVGGVIGAFAAGIIFWCCVLWISLKCSYSFCF